MVPRKLVNKASERNSGAFLRLKSGWKKEKLSQIEV